MYDNRSESINELAAALSKAQGAIEAAKMDKVNPFYDNRKYASLAAVHAAARKPLSDNGLAVIQTVEPNERGGLTLYTMLVHVSGQYVRSVYPVVPVKQDPQGLGSALTYARRYSYSAIVGISSEDDDDGNAGSGQQEGQGGGRNNNRNNSGGTQGGQQKGQQKAPPPPSKAEAPGPVSAEAPGPVSAEAIKEIEQAGSAHYGAGWEAKRAELVNAISEGAAGGKLENLSAAAAGKMLKGIRVKIEAAAVAAAAQAMAGGGRR